MKYSFSGHESFHCKSLWLKKGYDYIQEGHTFTETEAVVSLGVGKNMVASIRYWMKAFMLTNDDQPTELARYIFDVQGGKDPYCEDIATDWILHYQLVNSQIASLYHLTFVDFQRERREFEKSQLQGFIKRKCSTPDQKNAYNENTVNKDISVLLQNYVLPNDLKQLERYSALLIHLGLLKEIDKGVYHFQEIPAIDVPDAVILYALYNIGGEDRIISFDKLQELSLIFCIPITAFLEKLRNLSEEYPKYIKYSDNSGIRNVYLEKQINSIELLDLYYNNEI